MQKPRTTGNRPVIPTQANLERFVPSWELLILIAFMVTVFGLATKGPVQRLPDQSSRSRFEEITRDPYDVSPERSLTNSRKLVEMGM